MSVRDYARDMGRQCNGDNRAGTASPFGDEMSQMAPFVEPARFNDRTEFGDTYISYYTWGEALGSGSTWHCAIARRPHDARRLMRALWDQFGRSAPQRPGYVGRRTPSQTSKPRWPRSPATPHSQEFFDRYIEGHDVVDYARLLSRAGLLLRQRQGSAGKSGQEPGLEVVPVEEAGQTVTDAQRRFRDAWLSSSARNTF